MTSLHDGCYTASKWRTIWAVNNRQQACRPSKTKQNTIGQTQQENNLMNLPRRAHTVPTHKMLLHHYPSSHGKTAATTQLKSRGQYTDWLLKTWIQGLHRAIRVLSCGLSWSELCAQQTLVYSVLYMYIFQLNPTNNLGNKHLFTRKNNAFSGTLTFIFVFRTDCYVCLHVGCC